MGKEISVLKSKKVLTIVLLALVLSLSAFVASAEEVKLDGWQVVEVETDVYEVYFYRDGERVKGIVEVPVVSEWWPAAWGSAPATMYYIFDDVTGAVAAPAEIGWVEIDDKWYSHVGGGMLFSGWHYEPSEEGEFGTMHYLQPYAATGGLVLTTNIPASWTYDQGRVTHRWFNFEANGKGALVRDPATAMPEGAWIDGAFYFGYGVTQGWVYDPDGSRLFYFGDEPVVTVGAHRLDNPWTNDERNFTFTVAGVLTTPLWQDADFAETFEAAVEVVLPGLTFIIIEAKDAEAFEDRAFMLNAGEISLREKELYEQSGGGWRIAIEGEFDADEIKLEIFG